MMQEKLRSRICRFTRVVKDVGSVLMGIPINLKHTSCFKYTKLSGNDGTVVPLKSRNLRELILPITSFGIFVKPLFSDMKMSNIVELLMSGKADPNFLSGSRKPECHHPYICNQAKSNIAYSSCQFLHYTFWCMNHT